MHVGKELRIKLGMKKRLASERQSGRRQKLLGRGTGGNGLEENGDVNKDGLVFAGSIGIGG
jgi:hypothetical protein